MSSSGSWASAQHLILLQLITSIATERSYTDQRVTCQPQAPDHTSCIHCPQHSKHGHITKQNGDCSPRQVKHFPFFPYGGRPWKKESISEQQWARRSHPCSSTVRNRSATVTLHVSLGSLFNPRENHQIHSEVQPGIQHVHGRWDGGADEVDG